MKFSKHQFTEVAFIFERANGSSHSEYEKQIIAESKLTEYETSELERLIVDGISNGIYKEEEERISAYWTLSKIGNRNLISDFQKWLNIELENDNSIAVFQLLIALDRLEEPVFNKTRTGQGANETELNIRDAKQYLNKYSC
ncbi:hypothetical protein [Winogradskyella thalassocola]|uniref:Uncharacterized protein n=1 Tax=Winogradskyella thalassocola TaxID=262004 RepID=A0A1G8M671_9FLAO|nr:hypothetical protein [Winogradskyella thalassocola]SDI63442.1 hypothetical protein SAMN04489796_1179 [Winogradskyella thalassocola]